MKRTITIIIGVIAILVGLGFILPALAQFKAQGMMPHVALGLLGVVLAVGGAGAAYCGIRKRRA